MQIQFGDTLPRKFYERSAIEVARGLLGRVLVHGECAGRIVETEAYLGAEDLAAHSARGITPRTRVIFGPPGHAYVYLIYGMHECLNIVAEPDGTPGCVLLRALEPLAGIESMQIRRNRERLHDLTSGPGKLTQAMGIGRDSNGVDMTHGALTVHKGPRLSFDIETTPRIGISESKDLPLRFVIAGNKFATERPAPRARRHLPIL
jgi:DNA-3-methyladenine glycosylase